MQGQRRYPCPSATASGECPLQPHPPEELLLALLKKFASRMTTRQPARHLRTGPAFVLAP